MYETILMMYLSETNRISEKTIHIVLLKWQTDDGWMDFLEQVRSVHEISVESIH